MALKNEHDFHSAPVGPLGIVPLQSCTELGKGVDYYLTKWRKEVAKDHPGEADYEGHVKDTYLIKNTCPRFGSGEAKGVIQQSIRGQDLYLMVDVTNFSLEYTVSGHLNHMSPDDHYQDLKRIIVAASGKADRINVIMPFLYEGRQHKRSARESLDCATALQELNALGVENIITFDAHDERVQNAIPQGGFESVRPAYQFVKGLLTSVPDLQLDKEHFMTISPDEGATQRAVYLASILGVDMGMFYKRRDYTKVVNGRNPIVAHEYLGADVEGKDVLILDDMISSGESILDVARELHRRKARRIFMAVTFGLFTNGMQKFDDAYAEGIFTKLLSTNLVYQSENLLSKEYYVNCNMTKYLAYIIDILNHNGSLSAVLDPAERIKTLVDTYKAGQGSLIESEDML